MVNWFQKKEIRPARTPDELEALFYWCTSNDNVLLLNIPPDQTGRIRENEIKAALETADLLGIRGGQQPLPTAPTNQAFNVETQTDSSSSPDHCGAAAVDFKLHSTSWMAAQIPATITLTPKEPFSFNRIALHEAYSVRGLGDKFSQARDFAIQKFAIKALQSGEWKTIHEGTNIGAVKTIRFPNLLSADQVRIQIFEATKSPGLRLIEISNHTTRNLRTIKKKLTFPIHQSIKTMVNSNS